MEGCADITFQPEFKIPQRHWSAKTSGNMAAVSGEASENQE